MVEETMVVEVMVDRRMTTARMARAAKSMGDAASPR